MPGPAGTPTGTILGDAAATLPSSVVTVPAYYAASGVLAQATGGNASQSAGSGSCSPAGACEGSASGSPSPRFNDTTKTFGTLALVVAAVMNVVALRILLTLRAGPPRTPSSDTP